MDQYTDVFSWLISFIMEDGLIMIPTLYVIAEMVKGAEVLNKRYIPLITMGISLFLTPLILGGYSPDNIVQAVLLGGISTWAHEAWKNRKVE